MPEKTKAATRDRQFSCDGCRHWYKEAPQPDEPEGLGLCRAHPPTNSGAKMGQWPRTHKTSWCGEHEPNFM